MSEQDDDLPDLRAGIALQQLADGVMLTGRVGDEEALLLRRGDELFAVGASCTHYGAALAGGLVVDDTLRCPLHHARFDLRSGAALCAPALDAIPCWRVERQGEIAFVRERLAAPRAPRAIVIVGGGAAALAAAEMLRRVGYAGALTMVSADPDAPCDRPNLSKDYLAGEAADEWLPLRPPEFYAENDIELLLDSPVVELDLAQRQVRLRTGRTIGFDALLLATGAEPVPLNVPGATTAQIHTLRHLADSRAIIARAGTACTVSDRGRHRRAPRDGVVRAGRSRGRQRRDGRPVPAAIPHLRQPLRGRGLGTRAGVGDGPRHLRLLGNASPSAPPTSMPSSAGTITDTAPRRHPSVADLAPADSAGEERQSPLAARVQRRARPMRWARGQPSRTSSRPPRPPRVFASNAVAE